MLCIGLFAAAAAAPWGRNLGDGGVDDVLVQGDKVYVTGGFRYRQGFVAAFSAAGEALWRTELDCNGEDLEVSPDGDLFVVGGIGQLCLARLRAADGGVVWRRTLGPEVAVARGSRATGEGITLLPNGLVVVTGSMNNEVAGLRLDNPYTDVLVAAFDPIEGVLAWARHFGRRDDNDYGKAIRANADGTLVLVIDGGSVEVAVLDGSGELLWRRRSERPTGLLLAAIATDTEGFTIAGGGGTPDFGGGVPEGDAYQAWVARFSSEREHLWTRSLGGHRIDWARAIVADGSGGAWVGGSFQGTLLHRGEPLLVARGEDFDGFTIHLDAHGNVDGARGLQSDDTVWVHALAVDEAWVTLGGTFRGMLPVGDLKATGFIDNGFLVRLARDPQVTR